MSRPLRIEFSGAIYHITSRGDRQENIYEDDNDREKFLSILGDVVTRYNWICHAYCLMGNHYHLIIETPDGNLSKGMRQLNGVFTQASNRRHQRSGHLFQGRYKAILVDKESYLLELSRYVVLNPLRAKGMVKTLDEWPWSSYLGMVGLLVLPDWFTDDWLLSQFGKQKKRAREKYYKFVMEGIQLNQDIWVELKAQIYLGDKRFVSSMQNKIDAQKDDWNIPKKQRRAEPKALEEIDAHSKNRNSAIIKAYETGAYSQREIAEYFELHPSTVGVIYRKR